MDYKAEEEEEEESAKQLAINLCQNVPQRVIVIMLLAILLPTANPVLLVFVSYITLLFVVQLQNLPKLKRIKFITKGKIYNNKSLTLVNGWSFICKSRFIPIYEWTKTTIKDELQAFV